jgi:hypothetical protein
MSADSDFDRFLKDVRNQRHAGRVGGIAMRRREDLDEVQAADMAAEACSLHTLGDHWVAISDQQAQALVEDFLYLELAYNTPAMMVREAPPLAARFMAFTEAPRATLTNTLARRESWISLSDATFDSGVVCIDSERIVLLWVEDED